MKLSNLYSLGRSVVLTLLCASPIWAQPANPSVTTPDPNNPNIVSNNAEQFIGSATDSSANLQTFKFYVKGPASGYNDGQWHLVQTSSVSGQSASSTVAWVPPQNPGPGIWAWQIGFTATDVNGQTSSMATFGFNEYPQPLGVSLRANDALLGAPITFNARSLEQAGNLSTLSFYVQGPGYSTWTNVGAVGGSGNDSTGSFAWTPPSAGQWQVLLQSWGDSNSNVSNYNPTTSFNVLSSGGGPQCKSLNVTNAVLGSPVTFTGRAVDSNSNTHLQTFSFYVKGPAGASGYNDGNWHLVSAVGASGNDYTAQLTWTPNAPGIWEATFQAWDATGIDDGTSYSRFIVANPASGAYAYQILVNVNQLNTTEANSISSGNSALTCDGVWAITTNSPGMTSSQWTSALAAIGSNTWAVTEDGAGFTQNYEYVNVRNYIGRGVDNDMAYHEGNPYANDTILLPSEIDQDAPTHGSSIVIHTRSWNGPNSLGDFGDHRGYMANLSMANQFCAGVAIEFNPGDATSLAALNLAQGIGAILDAGKRCYLLIDPRAGTSNFLSDVQSTINYIAQNASSRLNNPNLYIVLADYGRPGNNVSFLDPNNLTSTSNVNTISAAVHWLQSYRATGGSP